jgi:hypothetical protein
MVCEVAIYPASCGMTTSEPRYSGNRKLRALFYVPAQTEPDIMCPETDLVLRVQLRAGVIAADKYRLPEKVANQKSVNIK